MKKTGIFIFLGIFIITNASLVAGVFLFREFKYQQKVLQQRYQIFIDKEKRLECMKKSLVLAYDLSEYEAKYYSIIFDDFAQKYKIPWEIYAAVIRIESNYRTTLGSSKGAKGIGQMLEKTAKSVAESLGIQYKEQETLWNEVLNLTLSLTYLSEAIKKEGLENGAKHYVAGPAYKVKESKNNVGQYIGEYKSTVWKEFIRLQYIFLGVCSREKVYLKNGNY